MKEVIKPKNTIISQLTVPGDKSISHRSVMFGAIANGPVKIIGFLNGADCLSTIKCFRQMGIEIKENKDELVVYGKGIFGLREPKEILDVGNSGTTIRLLSGLLSWQKFNSSLNGDFSIQKRPMDRVIEPLRLMGADIFGKDYSTFAPIFINKSKLHGITYKMPVASAQVKSAVILAGIGAEGITEIVEPIQTRNHTEILLNYMGAHITVENGIIKSGSVEELYSRDISVPGDISSAAFFIVAALITPKSQVLIKNVNTNPTRTGIITALREMGADIEILNESCANGELAGDIFVKHSQLNGINIGGTIIPSLIDEIPILSVAALFAKGETIISDAQELKVKESNRIKTMTKELSKMGGKIEETSDGMVIQGENPLYGTNVESHYDHRVAMSIAIAALQAKGETVINNSQCVDVSFPGFYKLLNSDN